MLKSFLIVGLALTASGQQMSRTLHSKFPVADYLFENCKAVEEVARGFNPGGSDKVYSVELFPRSAPFGVVEPFMSDSGIRSALDLIAAERKKREPTAILFSVDGLYHFKCRDEAGKIYQTSSAQGDPLELRSNGWSANILHFDFQNNKMAHVYVVTTGSLGVVDGPGLLDRVTRLLEARFVFLYIRNDPWFYGCALDSSPYLFTDLTTALDQDQYLKSQTISCMTDQGCHLSPSWH